MILVLTFIWIEKILTFQITFAFKSPIVDADGLVI